jgi:hypothetical protein
MLGEPQMAALVHALSQTFRTSAGAESLKTVAIFSGFGLLVSLLCMLLFLNLGLDPSLGYF